MDYSGVMTRLRIFRRCILLLCLAATLAATAQTSGSYRYFRLGNQADKQATSQPGFALMGGGDDLDEAFRWLCRRAGGGDFLVLRAHGDDEYNSYIQGLCHLNSVATVIIPDRAAATDPFVERAIRHASGLFIAGGDQANYINFWMGSPVEEALNDAGWRCWASTLIRRRETSRRTPIWTARPRWPILMGRGSRWYMSFFRFRF